MKRNTPGILLPLLKIISTLFILAILALFTIAMKLKQTADDVWKQLGISVSDAQYDIRESFFDGHLYFYFAKNAKDIALGNRAAVVKELIAYAKKYYNSPEFRKAFQEHQEKLGASVWATIPPKPVAKTADSIRAEEKRLLEKQLAVTETYLNSPNPTAKKNATAQIENIKKQIQALDDPNNPTVKRKLDVYNRNYQIQLKVYNERKQNYDTLYPSDPKSLLKQRLQQILDITADVDFSAELRVGYKGLKYFVNPDYQKKPAEWKMAFRAGKPATDAIRAAAQQWLKELDASAGIDHFQERKLLTRSDAVAPSSVVK
jgi:hypothetical protein